VRHPEYLKGRAKVSVVDVTHALKMEDTNSNKVVLSGTLSTLLKYGTKLLDTLNYNQPLIQWAPRTISMGVKRPEREADNLQLVQ
jgi:hypothetical protein